MQTKQARSYSPGTTPVKAITNEFPDCPPQGGQCTWGWSDRLGGHYVRYINTACLKHGQAPALREGRQINAAA